MIVTNKSVCLNTGIGVLHVWGSRRKLGGTHDPGEKIMVSLVLCLLVLLIKYVCYRILSVFVCACRVTGTGGVWGFLRAASPPSLITDWWPITVKILCPKNYSYCIISAQYVLYDGVC